MDGIIRKAFVGVLHRFADSLRLAYVGMDSHHVGDVDAAVVMLGEHERDDPEVDHGRGALRFRIEMSIGNLVER